MVVHVFVEPAADLIAAGAVELLDDAERDHADCVRSGGERELVQRGERVRDGYVAGRALTRAAVSALAGIDPDAVGIRSTAAGKPVLEGVAVAHSVSHSSGLVAVAVVADPDGSTALGIDIETTSAPPRFEAIAQRFFTPAEQAHVESPHSLAESAAGRFVQIWCRKEAAIKALGLTLGDLVRFDTTGTAEDGTDTTGDSPRRWLAHLAGSATTVVGVDLELRRAGTSTISGALGVTGVPGPTGGVKLELHADGVASRLVATALVATAQ